MQFYHPVQSTAFRNVTYIGGGPAGTEEVSAGAGAGAEILVVALCFHVIR